MNQCITECKPMEYNDSKGIRNFKCKYCGRDMNTKQGLDRTPTEDDVKQLGFELENDYETPESYSSIFVKNLIRVYFFNNYHDDVEFEVWIGEDRSHARHCTLSHLRVITEVWG